MVMEWYNNQFRTTFCEHCLDYFPALHFIYSGDDEIIECATEQQDRFDYESNNYDQER